MTRPDKALTALGVVVFVVSSAIAVAAYNEYRKSRPENDADDGSPWWWKWL